MLARDLLTSPPAADEVIILPTGTRYDGIKARSADQRTVVLTRGKTVERRVPADTWVLVQKDLDRAAGNAP